MFLSAHAHNYQRYTRTLRLGGHDLNVPFILCGSGGHNLNPMVMASRGQSAQDPSFGSKIDYLDVKPAVATGGLILEKYNYQDYGYLRHQRRRATASHWLPRRPVRLAPAITL